MNIWDDPIAGRARFAAFASITTLVLTLTAACGSDEVAQEADAITETDVVVLTAAQERSAGIRTEVMEPGVVRREVEVPGSVQPPDTAQAVIGSIVEGRVVAVRVLPGDVVRAGQPLVEIHTHELSDAQRDVTAARARLTYHENAYGRSEELLAAGAVSLEEVERRRSELEAARAELLRAQEMVHHLEPSPSGNATAVATRDGTIFAVHARMGQAVLPGTPLVDMGRTDLLWVTAYVPEHTASTLVQGDTVAVRFSSPDVTVSAHLVRAGNFVDPANRSVEMRFELDALPAGVRPGSFAVVRVTTSESFQGLELPEEVAVRFMGRDVVFGKEAEGRYRALSVDVLPMSGGRVGVSGVPAGTDLVVEGTYFLKAALELASEAGEGEEDGA